jgi:hypothetical protein
MGMTERSYRDLKGKLPGGRCLIVIGTEGSALLAEGGVPANRAPAMSATLIAACEGAVVLSRAERSIEAFDLVAAEQLAAIKSATIAKR